jgi:malonyl-CoA/methylmalonyl-CoA synthetase
MTKVSAHLIRAWADHLGVSSAALNADVLRRDLTGGTLPGAFARAASAHPSATLRIADQSLTHAQLHALATQAASVLAKNGVAHGTRIIICAGTSMRFVAGYLAALHAGATVILANPRYTGTELHNLVERSGAALLLGEDGIDLETSIPTMSLRNVVTRAEMASALPRAELTSQDVALLAYTSGTTGTPKGVPLTHGMLLASIRAVMAAWRWSSEDTLVHSLPLFHQHGLGGLHATLLAGSNAVVLPEFDPHALLATVGREKASVMFGVPSIHQQLLALDAEDLVPLRRLRLITSGSAPLPRTLRNEFLTKTGIPLLERYGLTESGLNVSNLYDGERAAGTVGVPLPGVEVTLFDAKGAPTASGTEGEIALRGPQVFSGYLDDSTASDEAFWPGGWFRTGDMGYWDEAGRLIISGRLKELIISGGMNVAPREVEQVIEQFPGVGEAAVAGLPSERWGEEVAAWIVPEPSAAIDPAELIQHCRAHLAAFKCPKHVYSVTGFPRNAMGKIIRSKLTVEGSHP